MSRPEPDELTVTLRSVGDGPPAPIRFRRALKLLLRSYGLRRHWPTPTPGPTPDRPADANVVRPEGNR